MELQSDLALRIYKQIILGIDRPIGYTLDEHDDQWNYLPVKLPDDLRNWYVRHHDQQLSDSYMKTLAEEVMAKKIPGLSVASCRRLTDAGMEAFAKLVHLELLDLFNTEI